jgi:hypothetical protein
MNHEDVFDLPRSNYSRNYLSQGGPFFPEIPNVLETCTDKVYLVQAYEAQLQAIIRQQAYLSTLRAKTEEKIRLILESAKETNNDELLNESIPVVQLSVPKEEHPSKQSDQTAPPEWFMFPPTDVTTTRPVKSDDRSSMPINPSGRPSSYAHVDRNQANSEASKTTGSKLRNKNEVAAMVKVVNVNANGAENYVMDCSMSPEELEYFRLQSGQSS